MKTLVVAVILVVAVAVPAPSAEAGDSSFQFVSDASWSAYAQLQDGSVGPLLGSAGCICGTGGCPCCWTGNLAAVPGACWLWKPGTGPLAVPVDLEGVYLTKTIGVPGSPDGGVFHFAADDFAELKINGTLVASIGSISDYGSAAGAQSHLTQVNIASYLVPGPNTFVVRVQNGPGVFTGTSCNPCTFGQNPTGAVFGGSISYFAAVPTAQRAWGKLKTIYR